MSRRFFTLASLVGVCFAGSVEARQTPAVPAPVPVPPALAAVPLPTGKMISPLGSHTPVGSFPANALLSPDGKFLLVTTTGFRQFLSAVRVSDGRVATRIAFNGERDAANKQKDQLYYGLAFGAAKDGKTTLYVSCGGLDCADVFTLDADGTLTDTGRSLHSAGTRSSEPLFAAGLALSSDGGRLYIANNETTAKTKQRGSVSVVDTASDKVLATIDAPGFPYALAAITKGPLADRKVYATSENEGVVAALDTRAAKTALTIKTGTQPMALLLDKAQERLFVANAGSDTVSVMDTKSDRVTKTILLRPNDVRGLPGATPTSLALSPDEKRLYVTLADMNAVAVVDLPDGKLRGYLPTGWYPTAVSVSLDGKTLLVTSAKGVEARNPNGKPVAVDTSADTKTSQYIQDIIEGTVSRIPVPAATDLTKQTTQVIANNRLTPTLDKDARAALGNPGIKHVFYIIKENRTYDQILGDLPTGNGDKSLCLFPRDVTPNQHALAERFAQLDNFYCCAEVSADGWDWSVSGMASENTARNTPFNYSGRGREYDFEGQNNGVPVDLYHLPDVARAPGGYFWDGCAAKGVSFRNYGFYLNFTLTFASGVPNENRQYAANVRENYPTKRALIGHSDTDFRQFDMNYPDSELGRQMNITVRNQKTEYGSHHATSRYAEWKREFDGYVQNGKLPQFEMMRLPRDHTAGTKAGGLSPEAMVADNDYGVGQIVEAISHSPYWKQSAIFILEDDAQSGYDHVDAHRSIGFVISPWVKRGTLDSHFYNTDSMLRTMGLLLGLPPMCQYDAVASPLAVFGTAPDNDAPYTALLPKAELAAKINTASSYRAKDSARLLNPLKEESGPDLELNDILWRSIRGDVPAPAIRHGLIARPSAPKHDDEDDEEADTATKANKK